MKKNNKNLILCFILISLLALYLMNSSLTVNNVIAYTELFIKKLFPVTFVVFVFSSLLIDCGFIELITTTLHLNGSVFYVTVMSLLSGFPSGAKYTTDLLKKELISDTQANYLIKFTHFPNPLFILGAVDSLFINKKMPLLMLISLISSNIIIAICSNNRKRHIIAHTKKEVLDFSSSLSSAIISAARVLVNIYGISLFFYLISVIINNYFSLSLFNYVLINGFFDLTKGVFSTSLISNEVIKAILIILFVSLGSLSIHMQIRSIIANTNIKYKNFLIARFIQFILSIIIFFCLLKLV